MKILKSYAINYLATCKDAAIGIAITTIKEIKDNNWDIVAWSGMNISTNFRVFITVNIDKIEVSDFEFMLLKKFPFAEISLLNNDDETMLECHWSLYEVNQYF